MENGSGLIALFAATFVAGGLAALTWGPSAEAVDPLEEYCRGAADASAFEYDRMYNHFQRIAREVQSQGLTAVVAAVDTEEKIYTSRPLAEMMAPAEASSYDQHVEMCEADPSFLKPKPAGGLPNVPK